MEIQNKIREGNFETFYTVLEEASKKASSSNFILNDLIEVFIYLTFLFDNVNEIFIFSEDLKYLSDIYQKAKESCVMDPKRKAKLDDFWKSFDKFVKKEKGIIQFLYKNDKAEEALEKSEKIKVFLDEKQGKITFNLKQLNPNLSLVEGLNFFILVPQYDMLYTTQEINGKTWNACYFKNKELYDNAKDIFDNFLKLSKETIQQKANGNGE
jgi:hypothetical protein